MAHGGGQGWRSAESAVKFAISCHRGDGSRGRRDALVAIQVHLLLELAVGVVLLRAVARDVARLAALVAALACGAQRAAVGSRAVARDMAKLAT